jgi:hypothetical protein
LSLIVSPSTAGLKGTQLQTVKNNQTPFFITGVLKSPHSRFKKENLIGNNPLLVFDFDDSQLMPTELMPIFKAVRYYFYYSASHDETSSVSRFRILLPTDRSMTVDEHKKLMQFFAEKILKLPGNGLDKVCFDASHKFYLPPSQHKILECGRRTEVLSIDKVLLEIPRDPIVVMPTKKDLVIHQNGKSTGTFMPNYTNEGTVAKCREIIQAMCPHDRSTKAVIVAGTMKMLPLELKESLYQEIAAKGVDKWTLKDVREYALL